MGCHRIWATVSPLPAALQAVATEERRIVQPYLAAALDLAEALSSVGIDGTADSPVDSKNQRSVEDTLDNLTRESLRIAEMAAQ